MEDLVRPCKVRPGQSHRFTEDDRWGGTSSIICPFPEWAHRRFSPLFVPIGQEENPCNRQPDHTAYRGCDDDILINFVELHDKPFGNWANVSCWIPGDCSSYYSYYATMMPL